jgi:acetoin utilization protein AcuC
MPEFDPATWDALGSVHDLEYVDHVRNGYSREWRGQRKDLGQLAALFAQGTTTAFDELRDGAAIAVNFPGAKHHAMFDHSSGFCVFNDFALTIATKVEPTERVFVLDFDAHHGDGNEEMLLHYPNVITASIHEDGIFPGTGQESRPEHGAYNYPLPENADNAQLIQATRKALEIGKAFNPNYVFIAAGADGHVHDPLSSLRFTSDGYDAVAADIAQAFPYAQFLIGGAGGYRPDDYTPSTWSGFVDALHQAVTAERKVLT